MASQETSIPFIKNLASSDRKIRTSALASLQTYLTTRKPPTPLTDLDARKLWKGLFFALWMCDRPVPQQNLCAELAGLLFTIHPACATPWLAGFWATMSEQWTQIDVLRMEKFLLLVRRMVAASLRWTRQYEQHEPERIAEGLRLLEEWPFDVGDLRRVPVGLRLHVLDLWVDELEKEGMLAEDADQTTKDFVERLRALVKRLETDSPTKTVKARAKESLEDERLPWNKGESREDGGDMEVDDDGNSWNGIED